MHLYSWDWPHTSQKVRIVTESSKVLLSKSSRVVLDVFLWCHIQMLTSVSISILKFLVIQNSILLPQWSLSDEILKHKHARLFIWSVRLHGSSIKSNKLGSGRRWLHWHIVKTSRVTGSPSLYQRPLEFHSPDWICFFSIFCTMSTCTLVEKLATQQ